MKTLTKILTVLTGIAAGASLVLAAIELLIF
jgi:hypothetical protein